MKPAFIAALSSLADGYDVVLLAGQSNMVGQGVYDAGIDTTSAAIFQYDSAPASGTYRTIIAAVDPLKHPSNAPIAVGPGMFFAKRYNELTGRKVLLVPAAYNGTSLVATTGGNGIRWSPYGSNDSAYLAAIDQSNRAVTAALAALPGSRFVGTLWLQGESDGLASVTQANYSQAFVDMLAGFRAGITGASSSWCVICQMMPEEIATQPGTSAAIDAAHTALAAAVGRCVKVAVGSGFNSGDNLHYNAAGIRLMGTAAANGVSSAQGSAGEAAPGQVTGLAAGSPTNASMGLSWSAVSGARDYQVQYSLAGSGSWSTFSDGVSTGTSVTVTGLTGGTSYDFRVRAVAWGASPNGAYSSTVTASTSTTLSNAVVRMSGGAGMTESGDAVNGWNYVATSAQTAYANNIYFSDKKIPSGGDGYFEYTLGGWAATQWTPNIGIKASAATGSFTTAVLAFFGNPTPSAYRYSVGATVNQTPTTGVSIANGQVCRVGRTGSTGYIEVSSDGGANFTRMHTVTGITMGDLWCILNTGDNEANNIRGTGVV